ncbi:hypothetical protein L228DRAFT_285977 [Xylona heveae TC161]|uniref:ATP-grasp domain-containing protein n=1 Tax=Xylona heveae (strain CBS 132557 / TC161) TaxID=1328760 RepID=A0A164ZHG5_XYLHT|nr:hypothetical protein L228DRAFT_285977 [Xylona heveae TC161]KZF19109.1 hypothetical protein L228DRAFT_285977 [Xylona heveae TC161]
MAKGLALARIFHRVGHKVIGADFASNGISASGRFSRALCGFYTLTKPVDKASSEQYVQDLIAVTRKEGVDLWVSCSGVASAVDDGIAKEVVERHTKCKAIQHDAETTRMLHEKYTFIEETRSLGLTVPETHIVTSHESVMAILRDADKKRYIMKPVGMDDANRGDMTLLPRATADETSRHLSNLAISEDQPWVLQQFIRGGEYCTHALVINGHVEAFVACPSAELLMHYEALDAGSAISQAMLRFTQEFVRRAEGSMTGHLSFDFLVQSNVTKKGSEDILYPIECNPRAHTAVVLFRGLDTKLAERYLLCLSPGVVSLNGHDNTPLIPRQPLQYYWVGHDLVSLILQPLFRFSTGTARTGDTFYGVALFLQRLATWKDGTYEVWDPLPWWWLYHVYWPGQFLSAILQRQKWSRINVSTTKMFAC